MAVYFPRTANDHLYLDIPSITQPLTICCWFNLDDITSHNPCVGINKGPGSYNTGYYNQAVGTSGGDPFRASHTSGSNVKSSAVSPYSAGVWQHGATVFKTNYRLAYLDGSAGTVNTETLSGATLDHILIARGSIGVLLNKYAKGAICEVGIWSTEISSALIQDMANNKRSARCYPENLVYYWTLDDDYTEYFGGPTLNSSGSPSFVAHPSINYFCDAYGPKIQII